MWKDQRFVCKDGDWEHCALTLDVPPTPERFTELLQRVGERAKEGSKVEVPFEFIAPKDGQWWSRQSGTGIDVPLGRAGATKRQNLQLGKGTSQHVLIAGKTGSGKSTFLHCLITNLALHYSPDEVRFALVDFKKGVEFKDYAAFQLPHADVIAIDCAGRADLTELVAETGSGKVLALGIVDGRTPAVEDARALVRQCERLLRRYVHDRVWLQPACGLGRRSAAQARATFVFDTSRAP